MSARRQNFCGLVADGEVSGLVDDADDVGGFAGVAAVEDAAEFIVALKEAVGFVDEQRWTGFGDDAEEGRVADVAGNDGAVAEFAQEGEEGCLSAAFFGAFDADVGADVAKVEGVGVEGPEGEGFGGVRREDDVALEGFDEGLEQVVSG